MRRRATAAALALALCAGLAACGGSGPADSGATTTPTTQSPEEYALKAGTLCTLLTRQLGPEEEKLRSAALPPGTTDPKLVNDAVTEQANLYARIATASAVATMELRKLAPPPGGAPRRWLAARDRASAAYERYSRALGNYSNTLEAPQARQVKAGARRVRAAQAKAGARARALGLHQCAQAR